MIHPDAIAEFLEYERDSHDWMKELTELQLDAELARLRVIADPPGAPWPLSTHQKVCLLLGVAYPGFAFWLDMGLGKSVLAIRLLRFFWDRGEFTGALVLAKSEAAIVSWEDELEKWDPSLPRLCLYRGSSEAKRDLLDEFTGGVIVATYSGLTSMLCDLVKHQKKEGRRQLRMSPKKVRNLAKLIQCIIADEATSLASQDSRISQLFYHLRKNCKFCWELAGIPFGRDPTALWRQLYFIDGGETLGPTLGLFRAAFFEAKDNYFGGKEYKFRKDMEPVLKRIAKHRSIAYDEGECRDVSKVRHQLVEVELPYEATAYYKSFVQEIKKRRASFEIRKNAFIRMRQVASGYVGFVDDETGERAEVEFTSNPKIERLIDLIEDIPKGRKFVIWYEYTFTGRLITAALKKAGVKHQWLYGETSKNARAIQDTFNRDESDRGLLANHKVAAYSLNLQRANYEFVVEAPISPIDNAQMRKRLPRQGQTRTVFSYDIVCRGTVDHRILSFHAEGESLFKAICRDPDVLGED